ncbi:MAG: hypothetical protein DHS20C13_10680 [Thermodesulfobacteriota bacterium]|nr:MAG: hypothetical protein DHS20C13_10680 [Thermodesulfobacteriota bacterium]
MYKIIRGYYPQFILTIVFLFGVIGMFSAAPVARADLLVGTDGPPGSGAVRRFNNFGTYLGDFTTGGPGLDGPAAVQFGPDGNVYVLSGSNTVLRYNSTTGVFIDEFIPTGSNGLDDAKDMIFGPDGNLYLANNENPANTIGEGGEVLRFNGTTGAFMGTFIQNGAGLGPPTNVDTVSEAMSMAFGPDGFFYLGNDPREVLDPEDGDIQGYMVMRFNGTTGQYIDTPFPPNFLGLHDPNGMTIGPDCNLYISSEGLSNNGNPPNPNVIYRLNLTTGNNTPDTIEEFVPSNGFLDADLPGGQPGPPNRGMIEPEKIVFGPNGDLYVTSGDTAEVWRYNGTTGAIVGGGAFAMQGLGADSSDPKGITFFPGESLQCDIPFPVAQIPTLSQWGLVAMAGALGIIAFLVLTIRRKKAVA